MARLELVLRELREAVVACDVEGRIILFNPAAKKLFRGSGELSLGQSLFEICGRTPFEYTFRLLLQRQAQGRANPETRESRFICSTLKDIRYLLCSMSLIATSKSQPVFFILTFEDATGRLDAGRERRLLERIIADLRGPLTNLSTAADNLRNYPDIDEEIRSAFEQIMVKESEVVKRYFTQFVRETSMLSAAPWPLGDVHSTDLLQCVVRGLPADSCLRVTITGVPLWLQADTYPLTMVLIHLLRKLEATLALSEVDMEALLGDRRVYLDIVWHGDPLAPGIIDSWLRDPLPDPMFDMTVEEILERHDSEIWSQHHRRKGYSVLRVPVPVSPKQWEEPVGRVREQPIFYDFSLLERNAPLDHLAECPLSSLVYVVFDTETTGLSPETGDEILSLSAVRIRNQRILSGEHFSCLVRPRGQISPEILAFQGLTADSLQDKPPIREALEKFRSFVGDAVLVTHNASFEMKFFKHQEDLAGVKFDNPLLDTLLLSTVIDPKGSDHTLTGIGKQLGIETAKQLMAQSDTLATAQIFLRLLDLLQEKGISTLGEAIAVSEGVMKEKRIRG